MRKITRAEIAQRHIKALLRLLRAARVYSKAADKSGPGFCDYDQALLDLTTAATSYARSIRP
jgi:hypothetical protein